MGGSTVVSLVLGSTFFRVTDDTNCPSETFVCNERKLQLVKASGAWENGGGMSNYHAILWFLPFLFLTVL